VNRNINLFENDELLMLGLSSGLVRLSSYQSGWRTLFLEEMGRLQASIGGYVLDIQHIGSTSIPGMPAKPILDIGIAVTNLGRGSLLYTADGRIGVYV
jgi:GrpB-like predicted nucleotidyltransferase (UPF0157 family)